MAAPPSFPQLTRSFRLSQKEQAVDPTLRDNMENGMETTRARWTRYRGTFNCELQFLTEIDKNTLGTFYKTTTVYGALPFLLVDARTVQNPITRTVRFTKLPSYSDAGWVDSDTLGSAPGYRWHCVFEVREV